MSQDKPRSFKITVTNIPDTGKGDIEHFFWDAEKVEIEEFVRCSTKDKGDTE